MKKLMMAVVAVALAMGVNAAVVDWQYKITGVATSKAEYSGLNAGNYTAYLFDAATWEAAAGNGSTITGTGVTKATFDDALDHSKLYKGAASAGKYPFGTRPDAATGTTLAPRSIEGDSGDYYYVLVDTADPDAWQYSATAKAMTSRTPQEGAVAANYNTPSYTDWSAQSWSKVGGGGDVPEPTSGLLLLLGVAGLALRRKQA